MEKITAISQEGDVEELERYFAKQTMSEEFFKPIKNTMSIIDLKKRQN